MFVYTILPEGYTQVFAQVNKLAESDLYTVREELDFLNATKSPESMQLADKVKKALETKMGIQSDMNSRKLILTVICDYNYIHSK